MPQNELRDRHIHQSPLLFWDPSPGGDSKAREMAARLAIPLSTSGAPPPATSLALCFEGESLTLRTQGMTIKADFTSTGFLQRLKTAGKSHPLLKAIGTLKDDEYLFDATTGLGTDALTLAWKGLRTVSMEQNPVIFELVQSAWALFVAHHSDLKAKIKLEWMQGNSIAYLKKLPREERPAVIYLDPMFPEKKKTALPKKEMQLLRKMLADQTAQNEELFEVSLKKALRKVVVKRSPEDEYFGPTPNHFLESKLVRFDIYLCGR